MRVGHCRSSLALARADVTSDCDADSDVFNSHHYTKTAEEAVAVILAAGTDVDCGGFMTANAQKALDGGNIQVSDIDTVLTRLFKMRIRMGFFDPPTALDSIGPESVCNDYALELARDGVRQSAVLAKNDGTLPLSKAGITSAVVIGPKCVLRLFPARRARSRRATLAPATRPPSLSLSLP